ncbi:MAG: hypothetical protein WD200_02565 [Candidatus Andersenbacteria bacterium]
MIFREYVELLYQAYLQDKGYLQTLRDKIKTEEFNKDSLFDPSFENFKSINPTRNQDEIPHWKYHPNPIDPESGVYVYENSSRAKKHWKVIKEVMSKRKK